MDGELTAQWDTPEGEYVSEWSVRCYNENGYDETQTTSDNTVTFQNVDDSVANTLEIIAADMSVSQHVLVNPNSVTISDFTVDNSATDALTLNWSANRDIPVEGWILRYTVNGIAATEAITTGDNSAKVPIVPNANYEFVIMDGAGNAALGGPFTYAQSDVAAFDNYDVTESSFTVRLCKTPETAGWSYEDLTDEDYVNTFASGEKISTVLALSNKPEKSEDSVITTFAIYDETNQLVSFSHDTMTWDSMWYHNYCEMDIPGIPANAGTYEVVILFNGSRIGSQKCEITA